MSDPNQADNAKDLISNEEYLEYALELFKYHAEQRLKWLRYYLVILVAFIAGSLTYGSSVSLEKMELTCASVQPGNNDYNVAVSESQNKPETSSIKDPLKCDFIINDNDDNELYYKVCISVLVFSLLTLFFWLVDIRNRSLVEVAEKGLKYIESNWQDRPYPKIMTLGSEEKSILHFKQIVPSMFGVVFILLFIVQVSMFSRLCCISCISLIIWLLCVVIGILIEYNFNKRKIEKTL